jgi:hypothetical protein
MKTAKPLLLIDVDGVLNPFDMEPAAAVAGGFDSYRITVADGRTFTVRLNKDHGRWLRSLADDFELVWATTWAHEANTLIGPKIGLGPLPVIAPVRRGLYRVEKLEPVRAYVRGRPFAWIDDSFEYGVREWVARRDSARSFSLLISPRSEVGLTHEHIETLRAFAAKLRHQVGGA